LQGSVGNITVLSDPDGKFMVESGIAVSKDRIRAALDTLGAEPVKYVGNIHWHWDHADGDAWLHEGGATIVATTNTVKYLTTASRVEEWEYTFPPVVGAGVPTELLTAAKEKPKVGRWLRLLRRNRPRHSMRNGAPSLSRRLGSRPWSIKDFASSVRLSVD
jgi:glyoxylase-like metal-dependent hydrolase (beta-lactamase superfamily II)